MRKLAIILFLLATSNSANAAVPDFITYSGRITDGSYDGLSAQATITFRLYDAAEGGDKLWQHTETVVVQDGYFSVMLSAGTDANDQPKTITTVFAEHGETWMELEVGGAVLAGRQAIGSVPYAARSTAADEAVDARAWNQVVQRDVIPVFSGQWKTSSSTFQRIIGLTSPGYELAMHTPPKPPGTERYVRISAMHVNDAQDQCLGSPAFEMKVEFENSGTVLATFPFSRAWSSPATVYRFLSEPMMIPAEGSGHMGFWLRRLCAEEYSMWVFNIDIIVEDRLIP
jgi:hypothetical protein